MLNYKHMNCYGLLMGTVCMVVASGGCARESLRVAIAAQQRADEVQQAVFERQHDALRVLLFRDLEARLTSAGETLNDEQRSVLNDVWNERDLIEFWQQQNERSRALRLVGVDAKLYADQPAVDLLYKTLSLKVDRLRDASAASSETEDEQKIEDAAEDETTSAATP